MKKTVVALALATAASAAFATNRDPNKDCFESPQYPNGTPACHTTTTPSQQQGQRQGQTQGQQQGQAQGQTQAATANAGAVAGATAATSTTVGVGQSTTVGVTTGPTNVGVTTGPTNVTTGPTSVTTGPTNVTTGPTTVNHTDNSRTQQTVTDNSRTQQTVTDNSSTQQNVTDRSQNNSAASGNNVNITDSSRTIYKQAANRAAPDAAAIIGDGTCKTGTSVSLGLGTVDVTLGGAVASTDWTEGSEKCGKHELKKLEVATDAARESVLRASENPVDNALAHEQAKASSTAYAAASTALEARVNKMSQNGQPVEIKAGEWQKLAGLNVVVRKPTVVTVTAPVAAAPAPAPVQDCSAVIAQFVEYAKAMSARPAARPAGTPKPAAAPVAPSTGCQVEVDKALKAAGVAPKP